MIGVTATTLQWLITKNDGARRYAMRLFTVQPGGKMPVHTHADTEHEMFVIDGEADMTDGQQTTRVRAHDAIFVDIGQPHGLTNPTSAPFRFICVIPILEP